MASILYSDIQNSSEINTGDERVVYKVPQGKTSSVVINATNTDSTADLIRIAIKDYDKQIKFGSNSQLTTDFSDVTYGQGISTYTATVSSGNLTGIPEGTTLTFSGGSTAKVLKSYENYPVDTLTVTQELVDVLTVDTVTGFAVGDQIEDDDSSTIATIESINASQLKIYVQYTQGGPFTAENITGISPSTGVATISNVDSGVEVMYIDENFGGNINVTPGELYKFNTSATGLNGFKIYENSNLTTEYTTGVSVVGSLGSAGSYTLLQVNATTPTTLYYGDSTYGENIKTLTKQVTAITGNARTLALYDVSGPIASSETFTYSAVNYTLASVNVGAYGRINRYVESLKELKVFVDYGVFDEGEIFISPVSEYYYGIDQVFNLKKEDHIEFDKSLSANTSFQRSAIVLGSEYSVVTLSDNGLTNFNVYGFEE